MSRESCILGTNSEENKSNHLAVWLKLNAPFLIRELEGGSPGSFLWFRTLICKGRPSWTHFIHPLPSTRGGGAELLKAAIHMNRNGKGWRRTLLPRCPHTTDGGNCQCRPKSHCFVQSHLKNLKKILKYSIFCLQHLSQHEYTPQE